MDTLTSFESRFHPGKVSRERAFAVMAQKPIVACVLPVLILALVDAFEGFSSLLAYLYIGTPLALLIAFAWTAHHFRTTIATISVSGPFVQVVVVSDLFTKKHIPFAFNLDVRIGPDALFLTLKDSTYRIVQQDWDKFEDLSHSLKASRLDAFHSNMNQFPTI